MKKTTVLLLTFVFFTFIGFSQNKKDTSDNQVKKIEKTIIITDDNGEESIMIDDNGSMCDKEMYHNKCGNSCSKHMKFNKNEKCHKNKCNKARQHHLGWAKKAFALMPVFLFLFFFLIFLFWLRRENYKLSDALSSKTPEVLKTTHTRPDPADPSKTITEVKEEVFYPRSASKLIAFFTGIAAIIIAVCGISYFAYFMLSGSCGKHHPCGLCIIIGLLVVGMLPYIFRTMFRK